MEEESFSLQYFVEKSLLNVIFWFFETEKMELLIILHVKGRILEMIFISVLG